jgi:hypothetical protein
VIGRPMTTFVLALVDDAPFTQWGDIGASDLLWLAPWIIVIWILVPKSGESKALRVPWRTVLLSSLGVAALAFVVLVMFYILSGP